MSKRDSMVSDRLWLVAVLVFGTIILGGYVFMQYGMDVPEPNVSDLALERPALAEEDNAFAVYDVATKSMHWPEDDTWVQGYIDGSPVEEAKVANFVEQNAEALDAIKQAHTRAQFAFPIPNNTEMTFDHKAWRRMASLLAVKACHERLLGRYDESLDAVESLLHSGRQIHANNESLIHYFIGERFTREGVSQAADLAREQGLPPDRLDRLVRALNQDFAVGESLARAFKGEFYWGLPAVIELMEREADDAEIIEPEESSSISALNYLFQPNRTKRDSAELHRQIIEMIPLTYREATTQAPEKLKKWEMDKTFVTAMVRPNSVGRLISSSSATAFPELHASKCWTHSQIAGTRLLVALIRHKADTGVLPEELHALVPKYIESIPADPYDGKPFRYSKEKGIVYSIGIDLQDSGGSTAPLDSQEMREHTQYQFVEDVVFPLSE